MELLSLFTPDKNQVLKVGNHKGASIAQQEVKHLERIRSIWQVQLDALKLTCPLGNASTVSMSSVKIAKPSSGLWSRTHSENSRINSMC